MATRKYVSLNKLSVFLDKLKATFASLTHTHSYDELRNKPFYEGTDYSSVFASTVNFYEWGGGVYGAAVTDAPKVLTQSISHKVIWDGVEYTMTSAFAGNNDAGNPITSIGAPYGDYSNYPFGIDSYMTASGTYEFSIHTNSTTSTHTIDILELGSSFVTLDDRFISDNIARTLDVDTAIENLRDNTDKVANALKGYASGESVTLTDVSPLEHEIKVKIQTNGEQIGKEPALIGEENMLQYEGDIEFGKSYTIDSYGYNDDEGTDYIGFYNDYEEYCLLIIYSYEHSISSIEEISNYNFIRFEMKDEEEGWEAYLEPDDFSSVRVTVSGTGEKFALGNYENSGGDCWDNNGTFIVESVESADDFDYGIIYFTNGTYYEGTIRNDNIQAGDKAKIEYNYDPAYEYNVPCLVIIKGDYIEPTIYTPNKEGVISGIIGDGKVIIISNNKDYILEVEYNRDINGIISDISNEVVSVQSKADSAYNIANNAQTTANNALDKANGAQTTANNALDKANGAQSVATNAQTTANNALDKIEQMSNPSVITGTANGSAVALTDISPLEHEIGVKLASDTLTDFSSVTLTKYGKNIFSDSIQFTGVNFEENGDKIFAPRNYDVEGARNEYIGFTITDIWQLAYDRGLSLTVSFDMKAAKEGQILIYTLGKPRLTHNQWHDVTTEWQHFSFTATTYIEPNADGSDDCDLSFYGTYESGVTPFLKNIQIEIGTMETEYEQFQKQTYTPNADGTVDGVTSFYPTTTLLTNVEGITITAEYIKNVNDALNIEPSNEADTSLVVGANISDVLRYTKQDLTDAQKAQARNNIEAVSRDEVGIVIETSVNLFNRNDARNKYNTFILGGYNAFNGYIVSHPIYMKAGVSYKYRFHGSLGTNQVVARVEADTSEILQEYTYNVENVEYVSFTPTESGYYVVNLGNASDVLEYFMVCRENEYPSNFVEFGTKTTTTTMRNPLLGKSIALNGDSICYGAGATGGYGKILAENNQMTLQNVGVSGGTITAETYVDGTIARHWICRTIENMNADADYVIVEGGVNDCSLKPAFGAITNGFNEALDDTTFCGAMESICKQLVTRFAGKKIGFIIVHKCYQGYSSQFNGEENYYKTTKEICEKWGVPYLDLNTSCPPFGAGGIDELRLAYTYNGDGWHPNEAGYRAYYVPKIEAWLKTL